MKKRHRHKSHSPRLKRMRRAHRLDSAKSWLQSYSGQNIVRSYGNRYWVDPLCAVKELSMLGIRTDPEYIRKLEQIVEEKKKAGARRLNDGFYDSDGLFYFFAGYTSGGAPYGITWEEARRDKLIGEDDKAQE